jgi:hypothetical protein
MSTELVQIFYEIVHSVPGEEYDFTCYEWFHKLVDLWTKQNGGIG